MGTCAGIGFKGFELALSRCEPTLANSRVSTHHRGSEMRVAVVGAGITGLAVTHHLAAADIDVVTFEAAAEPGGVIRSHQHDGRVLEDGPQRFRLTDELDALVRDLGLGNQMIRVEDEPPLYIYADEKLCLVPKSVRQLFSTDLLTWREKVRLLREPMTSSLDRDETVAEGFSRKCGTGVYRKLIEPIVGGMYGTDPEEMPVGHALDRLVDFENEHRSLLFGAYRRARSTEGFPPVVSFDEGVQTVPWALYEQHEPYVHLNQPVTSIERFMGGQFAVRTDRGSVGVDRLVVTTPAATTASLLSMIDDCHVAPLAELTYNGLVIVHLEADLDRPGFGYQVHRNEGLSTLGVTWNDSLLGRDGVYTAFLGGMYEPELLDQSADELGALAAEEFERVTGEPASVLDVTSLPKIIPAYDTTWSALDEIELSDDIILATNYTARIGIPGRLREAKRVAERLIDDAEQ